MRSRAQRRAARDRRRDSRLDPRDGSVEAQRFEKDSVEDWEGVEILVIRQRDVFAARARWRGEDDGGFEGEQLGAEFGLEGRVEGELVR